MCRVDDQPASIFVDLGLGSSAPIGAFPWIAYIRLFMLHPREDGLSSNDEYEQLGLIEDQLEQQLHDGSTALYVGRNTYNGYRDFYFYLTGAEDWDSRVQQAMAPFTSYQFESGTRNDKEWNTYRNFLYPSDLDMQVIQDRRVIEQLKSQGDNLTTPREILHWIYLPHSLTRQAFESKARGLGFSAHHYIDPDDDQQDFGIVVTRIDTPSYHEIADATLPLFRLAKEYGGSYDGWETQVIA